MSLLKCLLLALSVALPASTLAQDAAYLSRPIRIIVPFSAGGGGDTSLRLLSAQLARELGQPVVVDNKPGANGVVASLVKVDVDGHVIEDAGGLGINPGGFTIHSAVHMARPDVQFVMHTHTPAGVAVSAMARGLLPLTQHAMRFTHRIARHDYEGVVFGDGERQRLQQSLGQRNVMLLNTHGLLVCHRSIVEAFDEMYYLERACQAQVTLLPTGEALIEPGLAVGEQVAAYMETPGRKSPQKAWDALLLLLDRSDTSYKS